MKKENVVSYFALKNNDNKSLKFLKLSQAKNAFAYYKNFKIDLRSGSRARCIIDDFVAFLESMKISQRHENPIVLHLMYEFGFLAIDRSDLINENDLLAIYIEYEKCGIGEIDCGSDRLDYSKVNMDDNHGDVSFKDYEDSFNSVLKNLLKGNCYQVNLTRKFHFQFKLNSSIDSFVKYFWRDSSSVGAYAHVSLLGSLDLLFASNSPESLFSKICKPRRKNDSDKFIEVVSSPIKGTIKFDREKDSFKDSWNRLKSCSKNQAELYMISDLLRNDLAKIAHKFSAKIVRKKIPLEVPGILHQCSTISANVSCNETLKNLIWAIFPGGSITGAPKKRVMEIISENNLENFRRRFYTGSTILLYKDDIKSSINIRSCEIDLKNYSMDCFAGGGITLKSSVREEFEEMHDKLNSFLKLV